MTSTIRSMQPLASRAVRKAILVTHGRPATVADAVERVTAIAAAAGVELVIEADEATKHGRAAAGVAAGADVVLVLGGDGTMLGALQRYLGTGIPVLGVNFGRVGFLCAIGRDGLAEGVARAFAGELLAVELPTLTAACGGEQHVAVNDVVVTSARLGRMVELDWAVGGEDLGVVSCDGLICSTPSGSTAYNLSNGGPVLMWGIDAAALTFVAPHSLHARPLVVPRGQEIVIENRTADVAVSVIVDGQPVAEHAAGERIAVSLGPERALLGTISGATFVRRYRAAFAT